MQAKEMLCTCAGLCGPLAPSPLPCNSSLGVFSLGHPLPSQIGCQGEGEKQVGKTPCLDSHPGSSMLSGPSASSLPSPRPRFLPCTVRVTPGPMSWMSDESPTR